MALWRRLLSVVLRCLVTLVSYSGLVGVALGRFSRGVNFVWMVSDVVLRLMRMSMRWLLLMMIVLGSMDVSVGYYVVTWHMRNLTLRLNLCLWVRFPIMSCCLLV